MNHPAIRIKGQRLAEGHAFRLRLEAVLGGEEATARLAKAAGYDRSSIWAMCAGHGGQKPDEALVAIVELLERLSPENWPKRWAPEIPAWKSAVTDKVLQIERQVSDNARHLRELGRFLAEDQRDGETTAVEGEEIAKLYRGKPVFAVSVRDGRYRIVPQDMEPEFYEIFEQACGRMATLMARAIVGEEVSRRIPRGSMPSLEKVDVG